jgi:hypothetical protein
LGVRNSKLPVGCLRGGAQQRDNKTMECGVLHFVHFDKYYESN